MGGQGRIAIEKLEQRLERAEKTLRWLYTGEWVLLTLCLLTLLYFIYGRFSQIGVLPLRDVLWSRSYATMSGVVCGVLYSLVHLIHLKIYSRCEREFTEVSTDIDRYYTGKGFEPVPEHVTKLVGLFGRYMEPRFWPGESGIKRHILAGGAWVLLTGVLAWAIA